MDILACKLAPSEPEWTRMRPCTSVLRHSEHVFVSPTRHPKDNFRTRLPSARLCTCTKCTDDCPFNCPLSLQSVDAVCLNRGKVPQSPQEPHTCIDYFMFVVFIHVQGSPRLDLVKSE